MKIALFANALKPQANEILKDLSHFLRGHDVDVVIEDTDALCKLDLDATKGALKTCDFIVSIGGDGSILHLVHRIGIPECALVGVNLGTLGFLADICVTDVFGSFESICKGSFHTTETLVIDGYIKDQHCGFSVNEIAIHRGCYPNLVDLAIHVDGKFLNTFSADGVIISTPSGSTAYSLSAGGPIVAPDVPALIITPICPHTLSNRPLVLMPKESISIELWHGGEMVDVAFDGQPPIQLEQGKALDIRRSEKTFRLISLPSSNYFATLRTKLGWTGSLRNP